MLFARKGELTSLRASVGRREFGRVLLPLPTRTGRMGKGILDQAELLPPAFKSGQLLPIKQMREYEYDGKKTGQKFLLHQVCGQIHSIQKREL